MAQKLDYLPFGQERLNEKTTDFETHFTFTDQEKDPESGLLYYGARYYNQSIGRFTQIDPVIIDTQRKEFAQALQNPQLLNAYSYTANNPLKYVDYEGEWLDTVVDIGFIGYDVYRITSGLLRGESVKGEFANLGLDIGGAALPGVVGLSMVRRGGEAAKVVDKIKDATKGIDKISDALKAGDNTQDISNKLLGTRRDNLLQEVENSKLKNIINDLYREHPSGTKIIGDGGAIDAFRHELKTGEKVGNVFHEIKINDSLKRLNGVLRNNLSSGDRQKTEWLLNNIKEALKGSGVK